MEFRRNLLKSVKGKMSKCCMAAFRTIERLRRDLGSELS